MSVKRARPIDSPVVNEANNEDETCGICLESIGPERFNYRCGHSVCAECFANLICPTAPEADENSRNMSRKMGKECPICRSAVSSKLQNSIDKCIDAVVVRPVSEAQFRLSRTNDSRRFFDGEIPWTKPEFVDAMCELAGSETIARTVLDILVTRYKKTTPRSEHTSINEKLGHRLDDYSTLEVMVLTIRVISGLLYDNGYITPCFICNLHKMGVPVGGERMRVVSSDMMQTACTDENEVRAVRMALESLVEMRKDMLDIHLRYSMPPVNTSHGLTRVNALPMTVIFHGQ